MTKKQLLDELKRMGFSQPVPEMDMFSKPKGKTMNLHVFLGKESGSSLIVVFRYKTRDRTLPLMAVKREHLFAENDRKALLAMLKKEAK